MFRKHWEKLGLQSLDTFKKQLCVYVHLKSKENVHDMHVSLAIYKKRRTLLTLYILKKDLGKYLVERKKKILIFLSTTNNCQVTKLFSLITDIIICFKICVDDIQNPILKTYNEIVLH